MFEKINGIFKKTKTVPSITVPDKPKRFDLKDLLPEDIFIMKDENGKERQRKVKEKIQNEHGVIIIRSETVDEGEV